MIRYAEYFVWFSVAALAFDWILRGLLLCYNNFRPRGSARGLGYEVQLNSNDHDITLITVKDAHLSWKVGQHIRLWIPRLGPFETHPLTIANQPNKKLSTELKFVVRAQGGFSRKLYKYSKKMQLEDKTPSLLAFLSGPYGNPPNWNVYETLVLISGSTGASFTLPILESAINPSNLRSNCIRRIRFLLLTSERGHIDFYIPNLLRAIAQASETGFDMTADIAVTGSDGTGEDYVSTSERVTSSEAVNKTGTRQEGIMTPTVSQTKDSGWDSQISEVPASPSVINTKTFRETPLQIRFSTGRPDIAEYIRLAVEITGGETTVVVCGGRSLVSSVRNKVACLSNERAVHKGTGAQGIHLFSEEYSL
jgi:FAD-binding domain/Ferric reductase NAD binding domain